MGRLVLERWSIYEEVADASEGMVETRIVKVKWGWC